MSFFLKSKNLGLYSVLSIFSLLIGCSSDTEVFRTPDSIKNKEEGFRLSTDKEKRGLLVGLELRKKIEEPDNQNFLEEFCNKVAWFYTYDHRIGKNLAKWAKKCDAEFVPMVWGKKITRWDGTNCTLGQDNCDKDTLKRALNESNKRLLTQSNKKPIKWLMGANEPWNSVQSNLEPWEAVKIWSEYLQPVADDLGLKLIAPNVTEKNKETKKQKYFHIRWLARFINGCAENSKCDVYKIKAFSTHTYICNETHWNKHYGLDDKLGGDFQNTLVNELINLNFMGSNKNNIEKYVSNRKIWVTETNCNWNNASKEEGTKNQEMCKIITGKYDNNIGSISYMNRSKKIAAYAWWTTWYNKAEDEDIDKKWNFRYTRLLDNWGKLTPAGKGYLNPDYDTDCTWD